MRAMPAILVSLLTVSACQPVIGPTTGALVDPVARPGIRVNVRFASPFGIQAAPKTTAGVASIRFELLNANDSDSVVATQNGSTGVSFASPADGSYKVRVTALDSLGNSITEGASPISGVIAVAAGVITYPGGGSSITLTVPLKNGTGERVQIAATLTGTGTPDQIIYRLLKTIDDSEVAQYTSTAASANVHFDKVPDGTYKVTADARKNSSSITLGGAQPSGNTVTVANGQVTYSDDGTKLAVSLTKAAVGVWVSKANMPQGTLAGAMAATADKLYFIGGSGNSGPSNAVNEYSPTTNTWATKAALPGKRQLIAAASVGGKIYAFGGNDGIGASNSLYEYEPSNNTWSTRAPMPKAIFSAAATECNGKIYVMGGNNFAEGVLDGVYEYDPGSNQWANKASVPKKLASAKAVAANGKVYLFGGGNDDGDSSAVYEYDPGTNAWVTKTALPATRKEHAASLGPDGRIYVIGGMVNGSMSKSVAAYDPLADSWAVATDLPTMRYIHSSAAIGGKIYIAGGYDPNYSPLASLLLFDL